MTKGTEHMMFMADSTKQMLDGGHDDLVLVGDFEIRGRQAKMRIWSIPDPDYGSGADGNGHLPAAAGADQLVSAAGSGAV